MRTANLPTITGISATLPAAGEPTRQAEHLCQTLHYILLDMKAEGFVFQQAETTDFTTFGNGVSDGLDDYVDRFDDLLRTGTTAVAANIPDVLPIIGALLSGGAEPVLAILLQGVLDTMLRHWDTRADVADGDPTNSDMSGVITALEAIETMLEEHKDTFIDAEDTTAADLLVKLETAIYGVLTQLNINLFSREDEQFHSIAPMAEE